MIDSTSAPLGPQQRTGNTAFATSVGIFIARLALAAVFIYHGAQLAFGAFGGPGLMAFSENMHLPALPPIVWAAMAAYGQFLGGVSMLLGLFARLFTLPLIINMLVAVVTVHASKGFSLQNGGYEYNIVLISQCMLVLLTGPGLISADAFLFRRGFWAIGPQPLANPVGRTV